MNSIFSTYEIWAWSIGASYTDYVMNVPKNHLDSLLNEEAWILFCRAIDIQAERDLNPESV